jgi:WD40 repeat protein
MLKILNKNRDRFSSIFIFVFMFFSSFKLFSKFDFSSPVGSFILNKRSEVTTKHQIFESNLYLQVQARTVRSGLFEGEDIFHQLAAEKFNLNQLFRYTDQQQTDLLYANSSLMVVLDQRYKDAVGTTDYELKLSAPLTGENGISKTFTINGYGDRFSWSPAGDYLAISSISGGKNLHIYSFDSTNNTFSLVDDVAIFDATKAFIAQWSPSGKQIAGTSQAANGSGAEVAVFSFDGKQLVELEGCRYETTSDATAIEWAPDGKWFSVLGGASVSAIFKFDGAKTENSNALANGAYRRGGVWSPDGRFFAVSDIGNNDIPLQVYAFENGRLIKLDEASLTSSWAAHHIAWSPDGRHIAVSSISASPTFELFSFDGARLALKKSVSAAESPGFARVDSFDWSLDGKYLFVGYTNSLTTWDNGLLKIFSLDNGILKELKHLETALPAGPIWIKVHPKLPIVTTMVNGVPTVQLWKFDVTGQREKLTELSGCSKVNSGAVLAANWSQDGKYLAAAGWPSATISGRVYRFADGTLSELSGSQLTHNNQRLYGLEWHPNGNYLAYSGYTENEGVDVNLHVGTFDGSDLTNLSGCEFVYTGSYTLDVAWHKNGEYLAVANAGTTDSVKCFRFKDEKLTAISGCNFEHDSAQMSWVYSVDWHPGGGVLAIGGTSGTGGYSVRVLTFNGTAFTPISGCNFSHGADITSVKWSPDGKFLLLQGSVGTGGFTTRILSFSGTALSELANDVGNVVINSTGQAKWAPDGKSFSVAVGPTAYYQYGFDGTIVSLKNGIISGYNGYSLDYHPSGDYIAFGESSGSDHLRVFYAENGKTLQDRQLTSAAKEIDLAADVATLSQTIKTNSNAIVSLKQDAAYDISGYKSLSSTTSNIVTDVAVNALDWSRDGKYVVFGTDDITAGNQVKVYKHDGSSLTRVASGGWDFGITATVKDVSWHPSGNYFAVAADVTGKYAQSSGKQSEVSIFELTATGISELVGCSRQFSGATTNIETVEAIDWSSDGKLLAVGGYGPLVQTRIYRFDDTMTLSEMSSVAMGLGGTGTVYDVAWHKDGKYLALGGEGGTYADRISVRTFDVDQNSLDGYSTATATNGTYSACETRYSLAWSPDGNTLATAGGTGLGGDEVQAFSVSGGALTNLALCDFTHGGTVSSLSWNPTGDQLAISGYTGIDGAQSRILKFENNSLSQIKAASLKSDDGVPIRYGDAITLKHKETGKFVQSNWLDYWQAGTPDDSSTVYRKLISAIGSETSGTKWIIKGPYSGTKRWNEVIGAPLKSGDLVRPESVENHTNLIGWSGYSPPVSPNTPYYGCVGYNVRANGPGVGAASAIDEWKIKLVVGSDGDIITKGAEVRLEHPTHTAPQYYLYSHEVDFETVQSSGIYEQEVVAANLTDGNEIWTISAVDAGAYKDADADDTNTFVAGGASGGSGRSISFRPDGIALALGGGLDNQGMGFGVKPFDFETLKDFTLSDTGEFRLSRAVSWAEHDSINRADGVDWSPDNQYLAVAHYSLDVRVYKVDNGVPTEITTAKVTHTGSDWVNGVSWHPSGKYLAVADKSSATDQLKVYKFDGTTLSLVASISSGSADFGDTISWHPSGRFIAFGSYTGTLGVFRFYDTSGSESLISATTASHGAALQWAKWSPSGKYLMAGGAYYATDSTNIRVYEFDGKSVLTEIAGCRMDLESGTTYGGSWHPSGNFAVIGVYSPQSIHLLKFNESSFSLVEKELFNLSEKIGGVFGAEWSKSGKHLSVFGISGKVSGTTSLLYEFDSEKLTELVDSRESDHANETQFASFSRDDSFLATVGSRSGVGGLEIYKTGMNPLMVSNSWANVTLREQADLGEPLTSQNEDAVATHFALNVANSNAIVVLSDLTISTSNALVATSWAISEIVDLNESISVDVQPINNLRNVDWSPDGKYLATASQDGTTKNLEIYRKDSSGMTRVAFYDFGGAVPDVEWHPSGKFLATSGDSTTARTTVFSFENEVLSTVGWYKIASYSYAVSWSPDGKFLANIEDSGGILRVAPFDVDTKILGEAKVAGSYPGGTRGFGWHSSGKYVAISGNGTDKLEIYSIETTGTPTITKVAGSTLGSTTWGHDLAWRKDGEIIVAACYSGTFAGVKALKFDSTKGYESLTEVGSQALPSVVNGLGISNSGQYVAAVNTDTSNKLRILKMTSGGALSEIVSARTTTVGVPYIPKFSPDDQFLAFGTQGAKALFVSPLARESLVYNNSWASVSLDEDFSLIVPNSWASASLDDRHTVVKDLSTATSNAIVTLLSAGITAADNGGAMDLRMDSLETLLASNSSKVVALDAAQKSDSWAIVSIDELRSANSNAVVNQLGDIYDLKFGSELAGCTKTGLTTDALRCANWSPDGKYLVVSHDAGGAPNGGANVRVYSFDSAAKTLTDLPNARVVASFDSASGAVWRFDGKYLAVAGLTNVVNGINLQIYKFENDTLTLTEQIPVFADSSNGDTISWSPNGNFIAIGRSASAQGGTLKVYGFDSSPTKERLYFAASSSTTELINSAEWSPNGTYICTCGGGYGRVFEFDGVDTLVQKAATASANYDWTGMWHPSGEFVAFGSSATTISVHRFSGTSLATVSTINFGDFIVHLDWSSDGKYLAATGGENSSLDTKCYLFDGTSLLKEMPDCRKLVGTTFGHIVRFNHVENDKFVVAGGDAGTLKVFPVEHRTKISNNSWALSAFDDLILENSSGIASLNELRVANSAALVAHSWEISQPIGLNDPLDGIPNLAGAGRFIDWSPDGKYLAASGVGGLKVFRTSGSTFTSVATFTNGVELLGVKWHKNGKYLAVGGFTGGTNNETINVLKFENETLVKIGGYASGHKIEDLDWHSSGDWLATGNESSGNINIFSFNQKQGVLGSPTMAAAFGNSVYGIKWHETGNYLLVSGDDAGAGAGNARIRMYSFATTPSLTEITACRNSLGGTGNANAIAWGVGGDNYFAVGLSGGGVGLKVFYFDGATIIEKQSITPMTANIYGIEISKSKKMLLVGGFSTGDHSKLYKIGSAGALTEVGTKNNFANAPSDGAFSPDDSMVAAVGGESGTYIYVYPISREDFVGANSWAVEKIEEDVTVAEVLLVQNSNAVVAMDQRMAANSNAIIANSAARYTSGGLNTVHANSSVLVGLNDLEVANSAAIVSNFNSVFLSGYSQNSLLKNNSNTIITLDALNTANSSAIVASSNQIYTAERRIISSPLASHPVIAGAGIQEAAWSPDGNYLALVDVSDGTYSLRVYSFDGNKFIELDTAAHGAGLRTLSWHPTGGYIVVGGDDGTSSYNIRSYSFLNNTLTLINSIDTTLSEGFRELEFHQSGNYVGMTSDTPGVVDVFEFNSGTGTIGPSVFATATHGARILYSSWSSNGNYYAIGGGLSGGYNVRVYAFDSGAPSLTPISGCNIAASDSQVHTLKFDSSGNYLAVGIYGGTGDRLKIYSFNGTTLTFVDSENFGGTSGNLVDLDWSSDGRSIVVAGDAGTNHIRLCTFDGTTLNEVIKTTLTQVTSGRLECVTMSPDDKFIVATGLSSSNQDEFRCYPFSHDSVILNNSWAVVAFDSAEDALRIANSSAIVSMDLNSANSNALVSTSWAISEIKGLNNSIAGLPIASATFVDDVAWRADGQYCALVGSGSVDQVEIFEHRDSTFTKITAAEHGSGATAYYAEWHPDGKHLAVCGTAGTASQTVVVYSFVNNVLTPVGSHASGQIVRSVSWSPDGTFLLSAEEGTGKINVYAFNSGTSTLTTPPTLLDTHGSWLLEASWSKDGNYFVVVGSLSTGLKNVRVYSFNSGVPSATLLDSIDIGSTICKRGLWFSDDSKIVFGCEAGAFEGIKVYGFNGSVLSLISTTAIAEAVIDLTNDDKNLAVTGAPGTGNVKLFKIDDAGSLSEFVVERKTQTDVYAHGLRFNPAESVLAVVGSDNLVSSERFKVYPVERDLLLVSNSSLVVNLDERVDADSSAIVNNFNEIFPGGYGQASLLKTNSSATYANSWAITKLDESTGTIETNISSNDTDISNLDARIVTDTTNIADHASEISALQSGVVSTPISIDTKIAHLWFDSNSTLSYNVLLSSGHKMHIETDLTLDCNGHIVDFPTSVSTVFDLSSGVDVTITDGLFNNFSESNVNRQGSNTLTFGNGTVVTLSDDENLQQTWKFSGNSTLDGRNRTLDLSSGGRIEVLSGGKLTLKNIKLDGVLNDNISCADNTSSICFNDVELAISNSYHFALGSFDIFSKLSCKGTGIFSYESVEASTIASEATFEFGPLMTFSYSPTNTFDNRLFFTDSTSKLRLDGATLKVTATGLELKDGTLVLSGRNYVYADEPSGATLTNGLKFGSEIEYDNLKIDVHPGGSLEIKSGFLDYRNIEGLFPDITGAGSALAGASKFLGSGFAFSTAWSSNGQYLAVAHERVVKVFRFDDGLTLTEVDSFEHGGFATTIVWHPTNAFLAMSGYSGLSQTDIRVLKFSSETMTPVVALNLTGDSYSAVNTGKSVSWHKSGKFLAVGANNIITNNVRVYEFDDAPGSESLTELPACSKPHGANLLSASWSKDGKHLAVSGWNGTSDKNLRVYSFDSALKSLTEITAAALTIPDNVAHVEWNPYSNFIAVATRGGDNSIKVYGFDGLQLTLVDSFAWNDYIIHVSWSHDGRYIVGSGHFEPTETIRLLKFDGRLIVEVESAATLQGSGLANAAEFEPEDQFFAAVGDTGYVKVYPVNREEW